MAKIADQNIGDACLLADGAGLHSYHSIASKPKESKSILEFDASHRWWKISGQ